MKKIKELTLSQLIGIYADFWLEIIDEHELHRYVIQLNWLDSNIYMIFCDISNKSLKEVSFDITKQEVDEMIDGFIKKLESV